MIFDDAHYHDHGAFGKAMAEYPCPNCQSIPVDPDDPDDLRGAYFMGPGTGQHFAIVYCIRCHRKLSWLPWPRTPAEQKRRRRYAVPKTDEDRCDFCRKTRLRAEMLGRRLEVRHLDDRAALIDAGAPADEPENLGWICSTPCKGIELALRADDEAQARRLALEAAVELAEGREPTDGR